ncbi:MAG TPA: hypothetical protein VGY56_14650 [Verrucomicrobiae bacterium]|nr:hypothetical protein [Verrucomicrobiae bacterium]
MFSPPRASVTDHTVTIHLSNYLADRPPTWIHPKAEVQGQTIYLYGYRTSQVQKSTYIVRLPASVNPQSVSVIWIDPDGSQLRIPMICPWGNGANAYRRFYENYKPRYHDTPPRFFWCGPGPTNGQTVLSAVRSGDPKAEADAQALIGSPVTFVGAGWERQGPDLETGDGIKIIVHLVPSQVVGPGPCGEWGVEVQGKLESMDFSNRVIHIEAGPEHWIVTWQL